MILVEHGPGGSPAVFRGAREVVVARSLDEVPGALARLDAARAAGAWVAGHVAYEAGHAFEARLRGIAHVPEGPLVAMGVFDGPEGAGAVLAALEAALGAGRPDPGAVAVRTGIAPPVIVKRGWIEVIDTACGATAVTDEDGDSLDELRSGQLWGRRAEGVARGRASGQSPAQIARALAEKYGRGHRVAYIGLAGDGRMFALDEDGTTPLYQIASP